MNNIINVLIIGFIATCTIAVLSMTQKVDQALKSLPTPAPVIMDQVTAQPIAEETVAPTPEPTATISAKKKIVASSTPEPTTTSEVTE